MGFVIVVINKLGKGELMSAELIDSYMQGPQLLREAIAGMTAEQIDAAPIPGKWSTRQVICHLADFEPIMITRFMRILSEENPSFPGGNPDLLAGSLAYESRDIETEIRYIEASRAHMAAILRTLTPEQFARGGVHSEYGPKTITQLLTAIAHHIQNHIPFIEEKRKALGC